VELNRYHRQTLLPQIGTAGQENLARSRVLLVGCGALGSVVAEQLVRGGVGLLRIVDRDVVELTNLQRQVLFDESDVRDGTPKAIAAAARLSAINSTVRIDPRVNDLTSGNVEDLISDGGRVDLIIDGTDNVETRYLLNDVAVKLGVPWIYGACVGTEGRVLSVKPGTTACLRCVFAQPPAPGELPTCDTAGVLAPVAAMVASLEVIAALKLLVHGQAGELIRIDGWSDSFRATETTHARRPDCITCGHRRFEFLDARGTGGGGSVRLCGRNAIQIRPTAAQGQLVSLVDIARKLEPLVAVQRTAYLLRCAAPDDASLRLTVFADGRMTVEGTTDPARARSLYARYLGS
jgi:adenylyltransferase/sulfurtransferase